MHEPLCFATAYLCKVSGRMRHSIMAAADLHLLAPKLDRLITPTSEAITELAGLTARQPSRRGCLAANEMNRCPG